MPSFAQFEEHFIDGGFNQDPHWDSLAPLQFRVFDEVLRTTGDTGGGRSGLVTVDTVGASAEWSLYLRLGFQPSDNDKAEIVLVSDEYDIRTDFNGYYVRIGHNGVSDALDFYRKDGNNDVLLKKMMIGFFQNGANGNLKVVKNNLGKWVFYWKNYDQPDYSVVDSTQDRTYNSSSYFGLLCTYTDISKDSFWFDDLYSLRLPLLPEDITPPTAVNAQLINNHQIDIYFNEAIDITSAQLAINYALSPGIGNPFSVVVDANNNRLAHLRFNTAFASNTNYTLSISNVKDSIGNIMTAADLLLLTTPYFAVAGDVVITEIMVRPPTATSLPNKQYIELKNKTTEVIRLKDWTLNGQLFSDGYLQPNAYVIICSNDDTSAFKLIGNTVGIAAWTTLTDNGRLEIRSNDNLQIDTLTYTTDFYHDDVKKSGGWSMELNESGYSGNCGRDLFWLASANINGGTPGAVNHSGFIVDTIRSTDSLLITNAIEVDFNNKPMDKSAVENIANYSIDNGISILSATALNDHATKVKVTLSSNLDSNIIYHFTVKNMNGCTGVSHLQTVSEFALTAVPTSGELVINEVMFHPRSSGVEFIEIYNTSTDKLFKIKDIIITEADIVSNFDRVILKMDTIESYIFPSSYIVFTRNKNKLEEQYPNTVIENCINVNLPSLNLKEDEIVLKTTDNIDIDRLSYNENWHFSLLFAENKTQGISLERIDVNKETQNKRNWHSAAKDTNATPGYRNSDDEYELLGDVHIIPEVFSPDGDGIDDIATITYSFKDDGSMVNVYLYNADGRLANHLVHDVTIPKEGVFVWNGDDENGNKKDIGIYFLIFERKTNEGKKILYKRKCVLAAKLN